MVQEVVPSQTSGHPDMLNDSEPSKVQGYVTCPTALCTGTQSNSLKITKNMISSRIEVN